MNSISQEAIIFFTKCIWAKYPNIFTPKKLMPASMPTCLDYEQVAMPLVRPITGKTICSYKRLMKDPTTAEMWQTAFGKDFAGMAQGNQKTGQKGTNSIFVMTHNKSPTSPKDKLSLMRAFLLIFVHRKQTPIAFKLLLGET